MSELDKFAQGQLQDGSKLAPEKNLYFNGFATTVIPGDISITLYQDTEPVAVLRASHVVAKSLAMNLATILNIFESKTGQQIMTLDDISNSLRNKS